LLALPMVLFPNADDKEQSVNECFNITRSLLRSRRVNREKQYEKE
jgi:hypothetical protein